MINIMEVCGTHTMAIAKAGIRQSLPADVKLLSGPGCPVCVTEQSDIDVILELSGKENVIIATYGDMIRVPGSERGDSLAGRKALGAHVAVVYSPVDALEIAASEPKKEVVFLGVGFETTAPGTAAAVRLAAQRKLKNFSVLSMLKRVEPALRALMAEPDFNVQGFLCPGHVATIIGEKGFRFLTEEYKMPAVIAGFEPEDIIRAIDRLLVQIRNGEPKLENEYKRAVSAGGNELAQDLMKEILVPCDDVWRGLGRIQESGLAIREEYAVYDARQKFDLTRKETLQQTACRCGEIIRGKTDPCDCPMFGSICTPEDPLGPCMVSSEGACAAAYKYRTL